MFCDELVTEAAAEPTRDEIDEMPVCEPEFYEPEFREEFLEPAPSIAFLSDVESGSREENASNQNTKVLHRLREAVKDFRPRFLDRLAFKIQIDERELDDVELDDAKSCEALPYEAEPYEAEPYEIESYETEPYEAELCEAGSYAVASYEPERLEPRFDEPASYESASREPSFGEPERFTASISRTAAQRSTCGSVVRSRERRLKIHRSRERQRIFFWFDAFSLREPDSNSFEKRSIRSIFRRKS